MQDTISAISTANGRGGVAVIRISGKDALSVAEKMFCPSGKTPVRSFQPYRLYTGKISADGFTDFGMCVYFRAPASYTGEDVVEFHCHGGTEIAKGIVKRTFAVGARPAEAGEFTKRAFLNGKMSLSAAEGVADMINADSESMIQAGYSLLNNDLGRKISSAQAILTNLIASIEVDIDYPEEDLARSVPDLVHIEEKINALYAETDRLCRSYETVGKNVKNGVSVAIVGKPNSGKSSLLNALLGREKAIVSDIEGTTRDVVEGELYIDGFRFLLHDTAGIRESTDVIERIGVERAEAVLSEAEVVLHVVDRSLPTDGEDKKLRDKVRRHKRKADVVVFNKCDLPAKANEQSGIWQNAERAEVSVKTGAGLEKIKNILASIVQTGYTFDSGFVVERRHYDALLRVREILKRTAENCKTLPSDIITVELSSAWQIFGEITGETANEEIITEIFSKFCVGK